RLQREKAPAAEEFGVGRVGGSQLGTLVLDAEVLGSRITAIIQPIGVDQAQRIISAIALQSAEESSFIGEHWDSSTARIIPASPPRQPDNAERARRESPRSPDRCESEHCPPSQRRAWRERFPRRRCRPLARREWRRTVRNDWRAGRAAVSGTRG